MLALALAAAVVVSPAPNFSSTAEGVAAFIGVAAPRVKRAEAVRLGKLIFEAAEARKVDPLLLAAIVGHESHFKRDQRYCGRHGCDVGLGQVNEVHVKELQLDALRLASDDAYNLDVAARLLARQQRWAGNDARWWSRYHSARSKYRARWEAKVLAYLLLVPRAIFTA